LTRKCTFFQHTVQLSLEEFHSPFGGKLDPNNRWVLLHKVIPWMSLEIHYAPQFNAKTGAPAKPFQMAFGAVYIQQRLGVTDRETVALITESPYLQFFIGLGDYQPLQPFDPLMGPANNKHLVNRSRTSKTDAKRK
jgi:IS5 family transposase